MRPKQYTLTPRDVEQCASTFLQKHVKLKDHGPKLRALVLIQVVICAACRLVSIHAICKRLTKGPSDDGVRKALAAGLPSMAALTRQFNRALRASVPPRAVRRAKGRLRLAMDLTLVPYHGKPFAHPSEIYRGEAKSGTTHFHAYATCYLVHAGRRYTLAMLNVTKGMPLTTVVAYLLKAAENAGIRPKVLLLDRGFYQARLVKFLQDEKIPFLMPMAMRGHKPSHPKGPSGTYVFAAQESSGQDTHTWKGKDGTECTVSVYRVRVRDKKGRRKTLVYIYGGFRPTNGSWIRETYRLRFGIESSYRQMRQARVYTCTRNPLLRLFFTGVALLLRNVWVWLHHLLLSEPRRGGRQLRLDKLRFRTMLQWLAKFIEDVYGIVETADAYLPPLRQVRA